ncbi:hypothetical protein ADEAN_000161000 [Angomonas deanei]|uniref:Cyclic nucleotide-binding domain-containing protein n=1 Tax=Angomonas deanei TaxID=59799 RepID=A0A7G2C391_9TRYP|nr:hypothetical protein ADEAN_000161000 [Angomonas deanei]
MQKGRAESVQHVPFQNPIDHRSHSLQPNIALKPSSNKTKTTTSGKGGRTERAENSGFDVSATSSEASGVAPTKRNNTLLPRSPASPNNPRRYSTQIYDKLPARRDSSIGATSMNPKLRTNSVLDVAAAKKQAPKKERATINFSDPEYKAALKKLKKLLRPILIKRILKRRRLKKFKIYPPRKYTKESVVAALRSDKSQLADWPVPLLSMLAEEVTYNYYHPKEILVYARESHLSSGLVVLLHGQVSEERGSKDGGTTPNRPIKAQKSRTRHSPDVLCVQSILCEDRNPTCIRAGDGVDVAIITSRWFWSVVGNYVLESSKAKDLLALFSRTVLPSRNEMMLSSFYATSSLLQRSWMWPFLSGSDRVKLARSMEVRSSQHWGCLV